MKKELSPQKGWNIYLAINTAVLLPAFVIILFDMETVGREFLLPFLSLLMVYSLLLVFVQYAILLGVLIYAVYRFIKERKAPIFMLTLALIAVNSAVNIYLMHMIYRMAQQ